MSEKLGSSGCCIERNEGHEQASILVGHVLFIIEHSVHLKIEYSLTNGSWKPSNILQQKGVIPLSMGFFYQIYCFKPGK